MPHQFNPRDISWLAFNERVLQEAMDKSVPLSLRIKFLGIFSNNLDEFFRVRVAGLKRALDFKNKIQSESFFQPPSKILKKINEIVIKQQDKFNQTWDEILHEMTLQNLFLKDHKTLNEVQKKFVYEYFDEEVESNITPILLGQDTPMPYLRDKSLYIGIAMSKKKHKPEKFAIIEIPSKLLGRFVRLPSEKNEKNVMLLEDVIIENLPHIFSYFGYNEFQAHCFKVTKDAEFDLDNDIRTSMAEKIEKAVKSRRKGKPTRFVFDKNMDKSLLEFLIQKLKLSTRDSIIPGQKIHNFKDFMDFPDVFGTLAAEQRKSIPHPDFSRIKQRVTDIVQKKEVLLSFPYHDFTAVIDLLREAAMDPEVKSIQITAYRLASNSKIVNTLINAVRNGKEVCVMLELRARFDEENNLKWKVRMEEEGIKVLEGIPNKKVHAKLCVIRKVKNKRNIYYGFVSTGNFNEKTSKIYADHLLMTSDRSIMADINRVFTLLKNPKKNSEIALKSCKNLLVCPKHMRDKITQLIDVEIAEAKAGRKAEVIIKVNSLSDKELILKLYEAAEVGVDIKLIIRGIFCLVNQSKFKKPIQSISIVDEYLEHARVMYFYNKGNKEVFISSADWMTRNLDYRLEAAVPIKAPLLKQELIDLLQIQWQDNVKARLLDYKLQNKYVKTKGEYNRSQIKIFKYLEHKNPNLF